MVSVRTDRKKLATLKWIQHDRWSGRILAIKRENKKKALSTIFWLVFGWFIIDFFLKFFRLILLKLSGSERERKRKKKEPFPSYCILRLPICLILRLALLVSAGKKREKAPSTRRKKEVRRHQHIADAAAGTWRKKAPSLYSSVTGLESEECLEKTECITGRG